MVEMSNLCESFCWVGCLIRIFPSILFLHDLVSFVFFLRQRCKLWFTWRFVVRRCPSILGICICIRSAWSIAYICISSGFLTFPGDILASDLRCLVLGIIGSSFNDKYDPNYIS